MTKLFQIIILFGLLSVSAFADMNSSTINSAGWEDLSPAEQASILKDIADKAAVKKSPISLNGSIPDAKKIDEWVQVGAHIGQGLAGAAKELGVAANDFVKTPVGVLTMTLITWNFIGQAIVHIFGSFVVLICGTLFIRWYAKKSSNVEEIYDPVKKNIFGNAVLINRKVSVLSDNDQAWCLGLAFTTIAVFLIVLFTF